MVVEELERGGEKNEVVHDSFEILASVERWTIMVGSESRAFHPTLDCSSSIIRISLFDRFELHHYLLIGKTSPHTWNRYLGWV